MLGTMCGFDIESKTNGNCREAVRGNFYADVENSFLGMFPELLFLFEAVLEVVRLKHVCF